MIMLDDDPQKQEWERGEAIRRLLTGVPVLRAHLPSDVAFYGLGWGGEQIMVGVEVKKPDDMANSVGTGRLAQQFRAGQEYGYKKQYLIHQGIVRPSRGDGWLEKYAFNPETGKMEWILTTPSIEYSRWDNYMNTLDSRGITIKRTSDAYQTAVEVVNLYHWWQRPPEDHQSLDRFYTPVQLNRGVPFFRKVFKEFDGVGLDRSMDMFLHFMGRGLSTLDVLKMSMKEWQEVKGIGPTTTKKMWEALHGEIKRTGVSDQGQNQ